MKMLLILLGAILALSVPAMAAEFLVNGDFEYDTGAELISGTLTDATAAPFHAPTGWVAFNACSNIGSDGNGLSTRGRTAIGAISDGNTAYPTNYTMNAINATKDFYLSARGGNTSGGFCGIYQEVTLNPGTYTLSGTIATLNYGMTTGPQDWFAWEVGIIRGAWGNASVPYYGGSGQNIPEYGSANEFGIWGNKNVDTGGNAVNLTSMAYLTGGPASNQIVVTTPGVYTVYIEVGTNYNASATNKARFKFEADDFSLSGNPASVPEPGSLLALGSGLLGLVGVIRRKR